MTGKITILSIDTATGPTSVALAREGKILGFIEDKAPGSQSTRLMPMIEQLLNEASLTYADLGLVACTTGPGSFTSIRVGLAAARGICLAGNLPSLGYTTLATLARAAQEEANDLPILALLNAGKGEVYYQGFTSAPLLSPLYDPALGTLAAALARIDTPVLIVGNVEAGTHKFCRSAIVFPRADALAMLASERPFPPSELSPFYIRPPDAKPMAVVDS